MGTLNILAWCSENANPAPSWVEQAGSVVLTFAPRVTPQEEVQKAHAGTKLALSWHQVEILRKCWEDKGLVELMALTGRTDRTKFRHQVLNLLLKEGLVMMTIPDKPRSSKQKYRLTEKGRRYVAEVDRQGKE